MICIKCGHAKQDHTVSEVWTERTEYCWECIKDWQCKTTRHNFIDNLTYIERLAEEKHLI